MELTKRSNFKLDLSDFIDGSVVIKTGLKATDFIGAISTAEDDVVGKSFGIVTGATDNLDGTVSFVIGMSEYRYDPADGQITLVPPADDSSDNS